MPQSISGHNFQQSKFGICYYVFHLIFMGPNLYFNTNFYIKLARMDRMVLRIDCLSFCYLPACECFYHSNNIMLVHTANIVGVIK